MKLSLTDKFLWSLYNFIEEMDRCYDLFARRTIKDVCFPDFFRLKREYERQKARKQFNQFIEYLKKKGYIKIKNLEQKQGIILTPKGAEKVLKIKFKMKTKKIRADGKWQMVVFDIPERKRHLRDIFRSYLRILGYKMFQQSIWICPFDVLKETEGIIRKYSLDPYVRLFLIEEIEI